MRRLLWGGSFWNSWKNIKGNPQRFAGNSDHILDYTILYHTILYYPILWYPYSTLYHTILYYPMVSYCVFLWFWKLGSLAALSLECLVLKYCRGPIFFVIEKLSYTSNITQMIWVILRLMSNIHLYVRIYLFIYIYTHTDFYTYCVFPFYCAYTKIHLSNMVCRKMVER